MIKSVRRPLPFLILSHLILQLPFLFIQSMNLTLLRLYLLRLRTPRHLRFFKLLEYRLIADLYVFVELAQTLNALELVLQALDLFPELGIGSLVISQLFVYH